MTGWYTGAIPQLEPKNWQIELVRAAEPDAVMIDVSLVNQFLNRGVEADSLPSDVILTTTIPDKELEYWFPDRVLSVGKDFGADAVVPCDCPVYDRDSSSFRRETIRTYTADLRNTVPEFRDSGMNVVALVKGATPFERGLCYDAFDDLSIADIAYYCTQYFTYGNRYPDLRDRLHAVATEFDPQNMMLIGLQSANRLPELPPNISAAAGQRWIRQLDYGDHPKEMLRQKFQTCQEQIDDALNVGQLSLNAFIQKRGWA